MFNSRSFLATSAISFVVGLGLMLYSRLLGSSVDENGFLIANDPGSWSIGLWLVIFSAVIALVIGVRTIISSWQDKGKRK